MNKFTFSKCLYCYTLGIIIKMSQLDELVINNILPRSHTRLKHE
jgi:hypothetical protein